MVVGESYDFFAAVVCTSLGACAIVHFNNLPTFGGRPTMTRSFLAASLQGTSRLRLPLC